MEFQIGNVYVKRKKELKKGESYPTTYLSKATIIDMDSNSITFKSEKFELRDILQENPLNTGILCWSIDRFRRLISDYERQE